jgi:diacylglycerol kinase (ATP)
VRTRPGRRGPVQAVPAPAQPEVERREAERPAAEKHGLLESFNVAIGGIVWAVRHQRHMQFHMAAAVVVVVLALVFSVTRQELLLVFAAITFVLVAEMLNTAIEYAVDLTTDKQETGVAKIAKDVAAGAVLIASLNAVVVAYLVFYDYVIRWPYRFFAQLRVSFIDLTVAGLVLVALIVVIVKAATGRRSYLHGGWPSGHAAVAFGAWVAVTGLATRTAYGVPLSTIAFVMAFLTAQSRVQTGVHNTLEVAAGALLGVVVMVIVFIAFGPR